MDSLFGPTPYDVGQARNQQDMSYAEKVARMGGFEQAKFGIGQGAAGLTRAGAGMMGMVDPLQQEASMREQVMGMGGDLTTSAGLKAKAAQFDQAGDKRTAMKLLIAARQMEAKEQAMAIEAQKQALNERKQNFQETEAFELKKREAEARIQQNQQRIDDARTSAADRAALLRENNQIKLMLGQAMIAAKQGGNGSGMPDSKLLNKDQRWVQKDGEWVAEVIPGTKSDQKLRGDFSKDEDTVKTIEDSVKATKEKIDFILSPANKSGFESMFGGYNAKFGTQFLSGNTAAVKQKIESLKSEMKAAGLAIMRSGGGVGQITEKEWKIMENMIDSIDSLMDEKDARKVLEEVASRMGQTEIRAKEKFQSEWGESKYGKQITTQKPSSAVDAALEKYK
jgi:hypothetical protein